LTFEQEPRSERVSNVKLAPLVETTFAAGRWEPTERLALLCKSAVAAAASRTIERLAAGAEVSVLFTDDAAARDLNHRFRGLDRATNVLSFPAGPPVAGRNGPLLGDVVLACETIQREAEASGLGFEAHVTHLIVHGFLHLIGYDHETDEQAVVMERLETSIMRDLGFADPYAI
jgi:probable rRNA maturation factor